MLGAAQPDALGAEGPGPGGIVGPVRVGPYPHPFAAHLVGPPQQLTQLGHVVRAGAGARLRGPDPDLARPPVDGQHGAGVDPPAVEHQVVVAHLHAGHPHHGGNPPPAGHHGSVAGHPTAGGEDPDGQPHPDLVGRRRLLAHQQGILTPVRSVQDSLGAQAHHPYAHPGTGRRAGGQHRRPAAGRRAGADSPVDDLLDQPGVHGGHGPPTGLGRTVGSCLGDQGSQPLEAVHGGPHRPYGADQAPSRSDRKATRSSMATRSWSMESRSRTVTARSSRVSKSMVTQNGVPISSWRR